MKTKKEELRKIFDEIEDAMFTSVFYWNSLRIEAKKWRTIKKKYLV